MDSILRVNKKMTVGGVDYVPGDRFDTSTISEHKVYQFLRNRLLTPLPGSTMTETT